LLWVLRDALHLTGTKYGCGIGQCGACTVHVGGEAQRACLLPVGQVRQDVLTIEGLPEAHPVKVAWVKAQVPQCGYCQSGQIMQAAALLEKMGKPTEAEIKAGMRGILCRCGTYPRILKAMLLASGQGAA
jgi:isoquinoline 1-oxidoreductase alpha subunit